MSTPPSPTAEGPRKAIVGTTVFSVFESMRPYLNLEHRLAEIRERVGEMSRDASRRHGRRLDVAVFPENALHNCSGKTLVDRSVLLDDSLKKALGDIAREHGTYLVVCSNLREPETGTVHNASLLFDREGRLVGTYRKVFCLPDADGAAVEGGKMPGTEFPVFDTDFGRVGMLICYDLGFEALMEAYAAQGVDLLLWPTMSPQTLLPRLYARRFGFYLVSATPRESACVFDPLGEIAAHVQGEGVVTAEIDFDYRILHWQKNLQNGQALTERFGDRVGFRFLEQEDFGIFWSNDPKLPIGAMISEVGVLSDPDQRALAIRTREKVLKDQSEF